MKLLLAISQPAAQSLNDKAQAWLESNVQGYNAGSWSPLYVSADGKQYGISWEDRLVPTFTAAELATKTSAPDAQGQSVTTYGNVQDVTMATEDAPGWFLKSDEPQT